LLSVQAKRLNPESYYQNLWCNEQKGQTEYELEDLTRVDCLLKDKAVEFDFANKWAECIGQSLYYGIMTNRTPVCALIMEKESDIRYLKRIEKLKEKLQLEVIEIYPKKE
jgi:hypothetical protein